MGLLIVLMLIVLAVLIVCLVLRVCVLMVWMMRVMVWLIVGMVIVLLIVLVCLLRGIVVVGCMVVGLGVIMVVILRLRSLRRLIVGVRLIVWFVMSWLLGVLSVVLRFCVLILVGLGSRVIRLLAGLRRAVLVVISVGKALVVRFSILVI